MLGCGFAMGCVGSDRCGMEIGTGLWVCRGLRGFRLAWVIGVWVIGVGPWISAGGFFFWVIDDRCSVWVISIRLWVCHGLREFRSA